MEANIRRIAIVHDDENDVAAADLAANEANTTTGCSSSFVDNDMTSFKCACDKDDRLGILDAILEYFNSPVSVSVYIFFVDKFLLIPLSFLT